MDGVARCFCTLANAALLAVGTLWQESPKEENQSHERKSLTPWSLQALIGDR